MLEAEWAKANRITPRTAARYRQQGLPWADFGGKVWIHVPGSREWLAKRIRHQNPKRNGGAIK